MASTPDGTEEAGRETVAMSVRGAAVWAMAAQYLSFAMQFAASVVISRFFLSPAEVGLFSIALAAAMLVAILQDFGLSRYISGLPRLDGAEIARCSSVALIFSLLIVAVIAALAWPMAQLYHQPLLTPILLVIASSYLFLPLAVVPMALLARTLQFRSHFIVNVASAAVQGSVSVGLAAAGYSAMALAWGVVAAAVTRALAAQLLRPALPWPLRISGARPVLSFGIAFLTPHMTTAALQSFPHIAGSASAMMGFIQMASGFLGGLAAAWMGTPFTAFGIIIPTMALISVVSYVSFVNLTRRAVAS